MASTSLHQAASGAKKGEWVACNAELNCRNQGSTHISHEKMKELKTALKNSTGKFFPMNKITLNMVDSFLKAEEKEISVEEAKDIPEEDRYPKDDAMLKASVRDYNAIMGTRLRNSDKVRETVIRKYEEIGEVSTEQNILAGFITQRGGPLPPMATVYATLKNGIIGVNYSIQASDEEEYNAQVRVAEENLSNEGLSDTTVSSWEDMNSDYYEYEDPDDYGYDETLYTTLTKSYITPDDVKNELDRVNKKAALSEPYQIAKSEHMPAWALTRPSYFASGLSGPQSAERAMAKVNSLERTNATAITNLKKRIDTMDKAASDLNVSISYEEELGSKIKNAQTELNRTTEPLMREALISLIKEKKGVLKVAQGKNKVLRGKSNPAKRAAAVTELEKLKKSSANLTESTQEIKRAAALEWLTARYPSTNRSVKERAAKAWLKNHPGAVEDFMGFKK